MRRIRLTGIVLCVSGLFAIIAMGIVGERAKLHEYERGKVDGQLLEIRLQGDLAQKTIDLLIDCIHLIGYTELSLMALDSSDTFYLMMGLYDKDSLLIRTWGQRITVGFLDPTDTMPAVERESILPIILWDTGGVR